MNPQLVKVTVSLVMMASAAAFAWFYYRRSHSENEEPYRSYESRQPTGDLDICGICLEEQVTKSRTQPLATLSCGHRFHRNCIGIVFRETRVRRCPICRRTFDSRSSF